MLRRILPGLLLLAPALRQGSGRVELEDLEGSVETRSLEGFRTTDPRALGAAFVRYAGLEPAPAPARGPDLARVLLTTGDVVHGRILGGDGDGLELALPADARVRLAIDEVAALLFPARVPEDGSALPTPPPEGDRLYRKSGRGIDRVDGLVQSLGADGVRFESRLGERTYPWDEVVALYVEVIASDAHTTDDERTPVVVDLVGQSRLRGGLVELDASGVRLATRGASELSLPAEAVAEIAVDDGSYRFLSDLPVADGGPVSPFGDELGMTWPHRMDRAFDGGPLRAGGRTWARGIGVHAPSRLTFALDGSWGELRGAAAIDEAVLAQAQRGSVRFRVLADGQLRWESPLLRGGDAPASFSIELDGTQELVLEVDPSTDAFVFDRADWLRPILVRRP